MTPINDISPIAPNVRADKARNELRGTIKEVVGSVFFGPLLRSMRNSAFKGAFGHGGRGEEVFQGQLDQVFAERAGTATAYDLGETLYRRLAPAAVAHGSASSK